MYHVALLKSRRLEDPCRCTAWTGLSGTNFMTPLSLSRLVARCIYSCTRINLNKRRFYEQIRRTRFMSAPKSWSKERQRCNIPIPVAGNGGPHDEFGSDIGAISGARYIHLHRVSLLALSEVWLPVPKFVILTLIQKWLIICHTAHFRQSQLKSRV
jgi:polyferredoxin